MLEIPISRKDYLDQMFVDFSYSTWSAFTANV